MDRMLNFYEEKLCQFRGLYGFTEAEAWKKTYNLEYISDTDVRKAHNFFKRSYIKERVNELAKERIDKQVQVANNVLGYEKADAMRQIQYIMGKCENSLTEKNFSDTVINRIANILTSEDYLHIRTVKDEITGEVIDEKDNNDVAIYTAVMNFLRSDKLDSKVGELYTKNIRLAGEMYNLINTDVNLKVDEGTAKVIDTLSKFNSKNLEGVAFEEE